MKNIFLTNDQTSKDEYKKIINETAEAITNAFSTDTAYSGPTPQELKKIIHQDSILPEKGLGWQKTLELAKDKILPNLLRPSSTDYMPHLHSPSVMESIAGELIISTFNQSMDSWDQGPVATEIELEVIANLCKQFGFRRGSDEFLHPGEASPTKLR
ncbi:MAG: hypothetical protein L6V86_09820 [Treponema sp.]|nr:MAG: hypothetical protein L6V86_09820 [Treponema sp.]